MNRLLFWLTAALLVTAGVLLSLNACGGGATTSPSNAQPVPQPIQHVVVIFQENRTPDNLFHDPVLIGRGADIAGSGVDSTGQTKTLNSSPTTISLTLTRPSLPCTTVARWMEPI
jgi:phospholipase C